MVVPLNCKTNRRFGVEIETNTLDRVVTQLDDDDIPVGADVVARCVNRAVGERVEIMQWDQIHNNRQWVVKPDSSCGIEINTPILKGWFGLKKLLRVADELRKNLIPVDERCSVHVHVNIGDLTLEELVSVLVWYIKCEPVFFDAMPMMRKNNRYCQLVGMGDIQVEDMDYNVGNEILLKLSTSKYFAVNCYHFVKGGGFSEDNYRKKTLEFRHGENTMCVDSFALKNWIRLLLHFVDVAKDSGVPLAYKSGDCWTGLAWMDVSDVLKFLHFDGELSPGLSQVRRWFIDRIRKNSCSRQHSVSAIWSRDGRSVTMRQIGEIMANEPKAPKESLEEMIYGEKYII